MRVGIFTDNDFSKVNGVTTALSAVLAHAPADIVPRVYTCESRRVERADYLAIAAPGVPIPFYREMRMHVPPFQAFLRAVRDDRIDVIHFTTPGPVGLAALWVASRLDLPMVGSFHTDLAEYTRLLSGSAWLGALMRQYMRWPYGKCEAILAPSESTRALLVGSGIDAARIRIWPRGVDTDRFAPGRRSAALRADWGAADGTPVLLFAGRLSREKGLDALPRIQRTLRRVGIDHRLVLVGDGPMRRELAELCPEARFTGVLPPEAVADAMASADLFVFPSRTDTAGNVVLEAQASGLPVLVTDQGGPREQMRDRQTGRVCATDADMASQAIELLVDAPRRLQLGRAARRYAMTRSWTSALAPLYRGYRDSVDAAEARRGRAPWAGPPMVAGAESEAPAR